MKRILVLDDDEIVVRTLNNLLKKQGYDLHLCYSGQEAIDAAKEKDFDLFVADLRMPGVNGLEAAEEITRFLAEQKKPKLPMVFITGYAEGDLHIDAWEYGKVLFKPFDLKEFLQLVEEGLKQR